MYGISDLSSIPVRTEPTEKSEMCTQVLLGEHFEIVEEGKKWCKIKLFHDGYEGWIDTKMVVKISKREYNFLSYNAKLRPHRLLTVFELVERNLTDNALVSFMCSAHTGEDYSLESAAEMLQGYGYKNKKIKE